MSDVALKLTDVTKTFGTRKAIENVSFELPQGAFLSIFGPNGAGKTTLLHMIATLSRPSSGTIEIQGANVREHAETARASIGFISHESMLYGDLTPEENLILYGQLYGVQDPQKRALELLDAVGMKACRKDAVKTFSRGMTQRIALARMLMNDPTLVLLDEPYAGLDPRGTRAFDELLDSIRGDRTFIMVSHDLEKGFAMCTHALILAKGKLVAFDTKEALDHNTDQFFTLYQNMIDKGVA